MRRFGLPRANLRVRIIAWSFIPTTLILLAVALVTFYAYQDVTKDLVVGRNLQLTRLSAGQLAAGLASYGDKLSAVARASGVGQDNPAWQADALRQAASKLLEFDGGVLILNGLGRVVATDDGRAALLGSDWSDRGFFRGTIHTEDPIFSDILPGSPDFIAVAVPVLNERGEFHSTLVGMFRLGATAASAFYGGIVKLRLSGAASTYLVDGAGRAIYHPDGARIGTDMRPQPVVQQVLERQSGFLRTQDLDHRDILATFAPVPGTPWGLVSEEEWSTLLASGRGYERFLLILLGLGVIVPAIVVTFGVRRITDPIAKLIAAAKEIAGGKFGEQITVHTGDELEELVTQFNVMSRELSESYSQLERRVAARTKELAALNAIAALASHTLDLNEILGDTLDHVMQLMRMDCGTAYRVEARGDEPAAETPLTPAVFRGFCESPVRNPDNLAYLRGVAEGAIKDAPQCCAPVVWTVASLDASNSLKETLEKEGVALAITVPLTAKGKLVGVVNLGMREPRTILPEELALLAAVGQQIGVAVENASLYDRAEQSAALAERTRLARELHDSVTQSLYSVTLYAEAAAILLDSGDRQAAAEHLRELRNTAQEALREMRLLIYELRPPALEKSGLVTALQARLDAVETRGGMKTELQVEGEERLPVAVQQELYHMALEALNNVIKHAHAQRVRVHLAFSDDRTCLEIWDDGVGFDLESQSAGLGLAGMRERAQRIGARLGFESSAGHGTLVKVEIGATRDDQSSRYVTAPDESGYQPQHQSDSSDVVL